MRRRAPNHGFTRGLRWYMFGADEVFDGQWRTRCAATFSRTRTCALDPHATLDFRRALAAVSPLSGAEASMEAVSQDLATKPF
jgi:hypothetical protein